MNDFSCNLEKYIGNNSYQKNGMCFSNIALINIEIDYENIFNYSGFDDALIVFPELLESAKKDGNYLIFTSLNGCSDEGGWEYVNVKHLADQITWNLDVGNIKYKFIFEKNIYISEINKVQEELDDLDPLLVLEPRNVIYPLDWGKMI